MCRNGSWLSIFIRWLIIIVSHLQYLGHGLFPQFTINEHEHTLIYVATHKKITMHLGFWTPLKSPCCCWKSFRFHILSFNLHILRHVPINPSQLSRQRVLGSDCLRSLFEVSLKSSNVWMLQITYDWSDRELLEFLSEPHICRWGYENKHSSIERTFCNILLSYNAHIFCSRLLLNASVS